MAYAIAADDVAVHAFQLVANTIETVTCQGQASNLDVISDGSAPVFYTVDGSTPSVIGHNCFLMPSALSIAKVDAGSFNFSGVLKFISTGTPILSVQRST